VEKKYEQFCKVGEKRGREEEINENGMRRGCDVKGR
jgi:hypothetical protein